MSTFMVPDVVMVIVANLLPALVIVLSVSVMWLAVCALNKMNDRTNLAIRLSYIMLGTGALAACIGPYFNRPITVGDLLLLGAVATMGVADRRRKSNASSQNSDRQSK